MSLHLSICRQCGYLIRRACNAWVPTQSRLLSSDVSSRNLELDETADEGKVVELSPSAKRFHDDMKAFFPLSAPWRLTQENVKHFNKLASTDRRNAYLDYLNRNEQYYIKTVSKEFERKARHQEFISNKKWEKDIFGLPMLWTYKSAFALWEDHKLCHADMFGAEIVIDCGFEKELTSFSRLSKLFIEQISKLVVANRKFLYPSKLVLCNLAEDSKLRATINKAGQYFHHPILFNMHTESYLDLYSRDELVYLSSDTRYEMTEYDPNVTYIIGGLPDRGGEFAKVTMAKARQEGIKCQRINLDKYLSYAGSNIVPLSQMIKLLNIARETNVEHAVKSTVPQRNVDRMHELRQISARDEREKRRIRSNLRQNSRNK